MSGFRCGFLGPVVAFAAAVAPVAARAQNPVRNPGMEEGAAGGLPTGWSLGLIRPGVGCDSAYRVELVDSGAHTGRRAVRMAARGYPADTAFSGITQSVDAAPFRGKTLWLRAFSRMTIPRIDRPVNALRARLWLRVERPGGASGFFDDMGNRPLYAPDWQPYDIVGTVAPDAERISFGLQLVGPVQVWLDDVSLRLLPQLPPPEPARPLTQRGLTNEVAFARLLGYVRFFHPSDEAAATSWDAFAIDGARAVESAPDALRLAAVLDSLFHPIAPTLIVHAGRARAPSTMAAPPPAGAQVVAWRHLGVGLGGLNITYRSDRVRAPGGAIADSFTAPARPYLAQLGGGVSAAIPLAVYADSLGTVPRGAPARSEAGSLPVSRYTAEDRATRLADVILAWTILQHFSPYIDVMRVDWTIELSRALRSAAIDSGPLPFWLTLRRMTSALRDGHGFVRYPAAQAWAIPPVRLVPAEGQAVVLGVGPEEHRLRPGDVVTAIDGRRLDLARADALSPGATAARRRFMAVTELLFGAKDTPVLLEVRHPDGRGESVLLRRTARVGDAPGARPEPIAELRPAIWYVDVSRARQQDFAVALPRLAAARGIVFDLRGGWNHDSDPWPDAHWLEHLSATAMAWPRWQTPVVTRPDRQGMRFAEDSSDARPVEAPNLAGRRAFLTGPGAISSWETWMSFVDRYRLGDIVGEPTAGTNGNMNTIELPGGFSVSFTGMKVEKLNGSRLHGVGFLPTVPVSRTIAGIAAGRDEQLERALEVVDRR